MSNKSGSLEGAHDRLAVHIWLYQIEYNLNFILVGNIELNFNENTKKALGWRC